MVNKTDVQDTLLLIVKESDGVVAEYQRQLYEASLLGIERVIYCLVCDSEDNKRLDHIMDKLEMTCDILKMHSLDKVFYVWDSFLSDSKVMRTYAEGFLISSISSNVYFNSYKEEKKDLLHNRERVGKVIVKGIAQKYKSIKVSSIN